MYTLNCGQILFTKWDTKSAKNVSQNVNQGDIHEMGHESARKRVPKREQLCLVFY